MEKRGYVYILASDVNGTLYVDVTSDITKRIYQHKNNTFEGFTSRYNVHKLVYLEVFEDILSAIEREKKIKKYKRQYKINLIQAENPSWNDLYETLF